jgi:DNA-binding PadR family transcriptional regulator
MIAAPKIKLSKRDRRVLVVLLTDATNLSGWTLARYAKVSGWRLYAFLDRLENEGLVQASGKPENRCYRLTPDGWVWAWDVLGLNPPEVRRG